MLLLFATLAHAECPGRTTTADLSSAVTAAETAYLAMNLDAFQAARTQADDAIPCLAEFVSPPDAAAYHRLIALDAYVAQDNPRTLGSFMSALAIQPGYVLPSTIAPQGNPLDAIYQMARIQPPGRTAALVAPAGAVTLVDGARSANRPTERPTILQLGAGTGEVLWSGYLPADAPNPDWSAYSPAPASALPQEAPKHARRSPAVPFAIGAGGGALAGGALYALALAGRAEFDDPATPLEELDGIRARTNGEVYAAAGLGVLALGLGTIAVVSLQW
ncbi:MAG: hypothetical protein Q8P18_17200 [Pseudomonadota bacterium]|nr:hypothetical protein [Pseudomonadota bacterium]